VRSSCRWAVKSHLTAMRRIHDAVRGYYAPYAYLSPYTSCIMTAVDC
jgi:hypothetical protein